MSKRVEQYCCMRCGTPMSLNSQYMERDSNPESEYDRMFASFVCSNCGASYDVFETAEESKEEYPYWQEEKEPLNMF